MTAERAEAYGQLMRRLRNLPTSEVLPHEQQQIRDAADALLFSTDDARDEEARDALAEATRLVDGLVQVGRWQDGAARRLLRELEACGPLMPVP